MFEKFKQFPLVWIFYKIPGLFWLYHLLLAFFAAVFYGFPSRHIFVIGVTGTKGKTTVLELLNAILEAAGKKTALLSSLRIKIGEHSEKNRIGNTMPGRFFIQRFLSRAVAAQCRYALIEATSEGAALHRHKFINWNVGLLTGLHPEHIESHGSFEKYRDAKLKFLRYVTARRGKVFINKDDKNAEYFAERLAGPNSILYSRRDEEILHAMPSELPLRGAIDEHAFVWSDFNRANAAAAIAVALNLGIDIKTIAQALANFRGVPGRMEFVRRGGITAVIDYAHTPESLQKVYDFLKGSRVVGSGSRLICVLGAAGGGRDRWKRKEFGKIVAEYCDEIVLTSEDPYDEQPEAIIDQIADGCSQIQNSKYEIRKIVDRKKAIQKAVELAREGDIVVATGIGSQEFMYFEKGRKVSWNEKAIVEEALKQKAA